MKKFVGYIIAGVIGFIGGVVVDSMANKEAERHVEEEVAKVARFSDELKRQEEINKQYIAMSKNICELMDKQIEDLSKPDQKNKELENIVKEMDDIINKYLSK